jgi:hypothetical protein
VVCSATSVDQLLGRAFSVEVVRREIDAIRDLETAKEAARMLLAQVEIQRQVSDLIIHWDWQSQRPF